MHRCNPMLRPWLLAVCRVEGIRVDDEAQDEVCIEARLGRACCLLLLLQSSVALCEHHSFSPVLHDQAGWCTLQVGCLTVKGAHTLALPSGPPLHPLLPCADGLPLGGRCQHLPGH